MIIYQEEIRRFGVRIASGRCTLEDGRWFQRQHDGTKRPSDDPLRTTRSVAAATADDLNGSEPAVEIPPQGGE